MAKKNTTIQYNEEFIKQAGHELERLKDVDFEKKKNIFGQEKIEFTEEDVKRLQQKNNILRAQLEKVNENLTIISEKLKLMNSKRYVVENKILIEQSEKFQKVILADKKNERDNQREIGKLQNQTQQLKEDNKKLTVEIDAIKEKYKNLEAKYQLSILSQKANLDKRINLIKTRQAKKIILDDIQTQNIPEPVQEKREERHKNMEYGYQKIQNDECAVPRYRIHKNKNQTILMDIASEETKNKIEASQFLEEHRKNRIAKEMVKQDEEKKTFKIPNIKNTIAIGTIQNNNEIFHAVKEIVIVDCNGRILFNRNLNCQTEKTKQRYKNQVKDILNRKNLTLVGFDIEKALLLLFGEQITSNAKCIMDVKKGYEYYLNRAEPNAKIKICSMPEDVVKMIGLEKNYPNEGALFQTIACMDIYRWFEKSFDSFEELEKASSLGSYHDVLESWKK